MIKSVTSGLALLVVLTSYAQTDAGALHEKDTLPTAIHQPIPSVKRPFPYKKMLIPATMIAYGVVSLESDGLQDLHEEIKEEIWTERIHKEIHIDDYLQWAPAAMVYGLNMAGIKGKNNLLDRSAIYFMSEIIMSSTVSAVKRISGEWRPNGNGRHSFPSGHTANAFAAAEFLRKEYRDVSPWYGIAGYAMAATTGYLRMYNNKHWLGDVVAGAGVGILSTNIAYYMYPAVKRILFKNRSMHTIVLPTYQNGHIGLGLMHGF
jgi:hypothetical protein